MNNSISHKQLASISNSEARRRYPHEPDGAKNEWKAMLEHFTEAEQKAYMIENSYDQLKKRKQREGNLSEKPNQKILTNNFQN